jgi:proteasome lid subunit RPN8/RPN11
MLHTIRQSADRLFSELSRSLLAARNGKAQARTKTAEPVRYEPLRHVTLTDQVARTLFDEYAAHRAGPSGSQETGWILLGIRERHEAIVLATLPAGTQGDASVAHIEFNTDAQVLGSRIVRQVDRRLTILGLVHTHPGTLRHPSDGDYRGDSQWVAQLRGKEGVFGIGTIEDVPVQEVVFARQPRPHVQCYAGMCLSWYTLAAGDARYRPLPQRLTVGPDLARSLHGVWPEIEAHAEQLDRLYRQQADVTFGVVPGKKRLALAVNVPLARPGEAVRVLMEDSEVSYYLQRNGDLVAVDPSETRVDRGVYLLMAEVAAPPV